MSGASEPAIEWWDEWERGLATLRAAGVTHVGIGRELTVMPPFVVVLSEQQRAELLRAIERGTYLQRRRRLRHARRARINRRGWA
jgi:hypothetical protein